ncbi:flagellar hook-associated protein FlgK [Gynuella sunshinyii]|uniref:Flagellar hook-associated protein 1 n=1 Tax=Gynuella sunshinyii YC6258 TaxID=1445510 RepID=A0A0C5VP58_9GAMM|nr:flagellar hook-associated protein FlgK [Gynuella sunshinyii]AJQ96061.1 flagellar hook-associated protein [Gynuella sunshinyii YC6258]
MSLINTAISGLKAANALIETTGHNIANADTVGYTRQEAILQSSSGQYSGSGYIGSGVNVVTVRRVYDEYLVDQLRGDTSTYFQYSAYLENIEQVDTLIAKDSTGLQSQMDSFFASLQASADNPAYLPSRDVVMSELEGLVDRFESIHGYLQSQADTVNGQLSAMVEEVNTLVDSIADLNLKILSAQGTLDTTPPNDLLDQRDELVRQLSEFLEIEVSESNGAYNIFIGSGQALVLNGEANHLEAATAEYDNSEVDIMFVNSSGRINITDKIMEDGGAISGTLQFREEVMDMTMNSLGQVAVALITDLNAVQTSGMDMYGNLGTSIFADLNTDEAARSRVNASSENRLPNDRVIGVYFEDTTSLTTSNYYLEFTGPEDYNYQVIREDDGAIVSEGSVGTDLPADIYFDGLKVTLESGSFQQGDSFEIQPLKHVINDLEVVLKSAEELAFAYPITSTTSLGNTGSGAIDQGQMLDVSTSYFSQDGELTPPLAIVFIDESTYSIKDATDPDNLVDLDPPMNNLSFVSGVSNSIFSTDKGATQVSSYSPRLPEDPTYTAAGYPGLATDNGLNSETFKFYQTDPETGKVTELDTVITGSGASAREIAEQLSNIDGVEARAQTTVEITGLTNSGTPYDPDNTFEVWINGYQITVDDLAENQAIFEEGYPEEVPENLTVDFLADRINSHMELKKAGIYAVSDGESLKIYDKNGDDITVAITGDEPSVGTILPSGAAASVDPGDTLQISTGDEYVLNPIAGETRGMINNNTGYDFSTGGPYQYEFELPDGRTGTITMDKNYNTADDMIADFESKINALLDSPGDVNLEINERGEISYKVFMTMEGTGSDATNNITIGGSVDVVMASGISLSADPGAGSIFTHQPEAKSIYTGFQFEITGNPEAGDSFYINWNSDGISDNRNALDFVELETSDRLSQGSTGVTYTEAYSRLVERVGSKTNLADNQTETFAAVLEATQAQISSIQGVSLDEEAARLIQFELLYNANAQAIQTAQEMFDTLLASF